MEKTEQIKEALVTMRCLSLLFYNFTQESIKELCTHREFNYAWNEKLMPKYKKKKLMAVPDYMFYELFVTVSYKTQRAIIAEAFRVYETEARNGIVNADMFHAFAEEKIKADIEQRDKS